MAQRISVETKQKIAALYAEGHSGCKIAKIVGVSASSVCRIIKFKSEPAKSFRPAVVVCNEFEHINAMKTDPLAKI